MQFAQRSRNPKKWWAFAASVTVLLLLGAPTCVSSQEVPDSLLGRRVRLTFRGSPTDAVHVGTLRRADSRGLALRTSKGVVAQFPVAQLMGVEVSESDRGHKMLQGLGLGALSGAVIFRLWADHHYLDDEFNTLGAMVLGLPAGGFAGLMVGAALATEQWVPIDVGNGGGVRPRLTLRFSLPSTGRN